MGRIKMKQIKEMNNEEREKKIKEFELELIKSSANAQKTGNAKASEVRKVIAKIYTINSQERGLKNK